MPQNQAQQSFGFMDKKAMLLDHLATAERHVERGREIVARQRAIVRELARDGHDTTSAVDLLQLFEQLQDLHIADRDRLRWELKAIDQLK